MHFYVGMSSTWHAGYLMGKVEILDQKYIELEPIPEYQSCMPLSLTKEHNKYQSFHALVCMITALTIHHIGPKKIQTFVVGPVHSSEENYSKCK